MAKRNGGMKKEKIPTYSICNLIGAKNCATDIYVSKLSDFIATHSDLYFPHRHSFYQIVLFTQGAGNHSIDFNDFEVSPHQIYYMSPGQIHTWSFGADIDGYLVNFDENFFTVFLQNTQFIKKLPLFNRITHQPTQVLEANCCFEIVGLFQKLYTEFNGEQLYKSETLHAILLEILVKLARTQYNNQIDNATKHHLSILQQFEELIENHFLEKRLPKEYAELLFITPNHLNAICNSTVGKAAGEIIRERVILEAKRLIVNSNESISEIAYQLNFEDNAYFSRFFKKYTSLSPEEFRKQMK
jgi:AraC family transcriptional regulator, transcriptional activator of pobA